MQTWFYSTNRSEAKSERFSEEDEPDVKTKESVCVLIAEGTRDEGMQASAHRKEERMIIAIQRVRRRRRNFSPDLALLDSFDVKMKDGEINADQFVLDERKRLTRTMETVDDTPINQVKNEPESNTVDIPLEQRRPRGQSGLES